MHTIDFLLYQNIYILLPALEVDTLRVPKWISTGMSTIVIQEAVLALGHKRVTVNATVVDSIPTHGNGIFLFPCSDNEIMSSATQHATPKLKWETGVP